MGSGYHGTALRLRKTKTGPNQWVEVHNEQVQLLLRMLVMMTKGNQSLLFPMSSGVYRGLFKRACAQLGLSTSYVPHSLRHGGATYWHLHGHSIEDILLRGRWASTKSARRYVQAGRALLLSTRVPEALGQLATVLCRNVILSVVLSLTQ